MTLSSDTQAILLLTAPLLLPAGRRQASRTDRDAAADPLTRMKYNALAEALSERTLRPADLLRDQGDRTLADLAATRKKGGTERLKALLGRGMRLALCLQEWEKLGLWVVSWADETYPAKLRERLRSDAPPLLYGFGDRGALDRGGLAIVGSRNADEDALGEARRIGQLAAEAGIAVISGGAKGCDRNALQGALDAGTDSAVIAVLPDGLRKAVLSADNRSELERGRLRLLSPFDPLAPFHVGNAMQRNALIYALADAALVIAAEKDKGGTWAGATNHLKAIEKANAKTDPSRLATLFVRDRASEALVALRHLGAKPWPDPKDAKALQQLLRTCRDPAKPKPPQPPDDAERLWQDVRPRLLMVLRSPRTAKEFAERLNLTTAQAKAWLVRLQKEGVVSKDGPPGRFRVSDSAQEQLSLPLPPLAKP